MPASYVNSAPPQQTAFTDERNRITAPWFSYLLNLQNAAAVSTAVAGIPNASAAGTGLLTAADWSRFNAKQAALGFTPLNPANNLSELANAGIARTNLGLGSAATQASSAFDAAGAAAAVLATVSASALQKSANLADVANVATARTNLGLGSAATQPSSAFDPAGAWSAWAGDVDAAAHNLSNVFILNTAGLQVTNFLAFSGSMYYQPGAATFFTSSNSGGGAWYEFAYFLQPGANINFDEFWISVNARTSLGGSDGYSPAVRIAAVTGAVTFPNPTTFTVAPTFTDAAGSRAALGLGSAATQASSAFDAAGAATAAVAGIPNASAAVTGHLTSADWSTFNAKQAALGFTPLNPANNLSEVTAATARTNLGLSGAAVMALPVSIANGGTGQSSAAAALTAMGGASLTAANTFSGSNAFSSVQVSMRWGCVVGSGASGAALAGELVGGASPVSARLQFGTDGSGWQLRIAKNQAGTVTDFMTFVDSGAISTASTTSFTAGGGFCSRVRSVTAADTATTSDHTILGNIASALTETLPAAPLTGQEFYLVNVGSAVWTISGNGKNIWAAGASAASITLAANAAAILKYDGTLWRRLL